MEEKLIKQIKTLRNIQPNASWLFSQRSFLLSEISLKQAEKREPSLVLPIFHFNILKIFKPAFAIALLIIIVGTSAGTIGVISAAQNSIAGDFLYPLKTAFEKTQFTFTPGELNKTKLSIKFATQRMDEFTQLMEQPAKKHEIQETVKKFTEQMVAVQTNIDKLKEKNAQKAVEVAKLVQAQTPIYEEALAKSSELLTYVIPGEKEALQHEIDNALLEVSKTKQISENIINESEAGDVKGDQTEEPVTTEPAGDDINDDVVPPVTDDEDDPESDSIDFEEIQETEQETINQE